jgi:hypothetical protein
MQKLMAHLVCRACEVLLAVAAFQLAQSLGAYFQV